MTRNWDMLHRARQFAAAAHLGQVRTYTGEPYIVHCEAVGMLLVTHDQDDETVAAGVLHDTIEDCCVTVQDLTSEFGSVVADLVWQVTDVSRPSDGNRAARKAIDRAHLARASARAKSVKLADVIDNTLSIVRYDPAFAAIYLREKAALLEVLTEGCPALLAIARRQVEEGLRDAEVKRATGR
jgi:(p)ppGpp synthase/HD superfamily hydrolase